CRSYPPFCGDFRWAGNRQNHHSDQASGGAD
ncbi:exodeoxyribonuclease V, 67 kDa subunit domain protein, partial [Vibrio cholerae O1 str. EC-0051]